MKVLFLDIDGVLNSHDNLVSLSITKEIDGYDEFGQLFDDRCVRFLDWIVKQTKCKIVISSSWRYVGLQKMKDLWKKRNLPGEIIDITPIVKKTFDEENQRYGYFDSRGEEIQKWLDNHKHQIISYCIVDDDSNMIVDQSFVKVDGNFGLTYKTSSLIVDLLNNYDRTSNPDSR